MNDDGTVNILVVDDRPDKLLALEAVLEDLGQTIVRAYSGREALRAVLNREFAVILLDVNMPDMDGFETASLIRQRKSSEHTPIIFITAFHDEMHVSRGYSLGAVDYILAPVVPDVLRTKVAVFVDLYRKSAQVRRQAESLRQRAAQLHKLTSASLAINSALSMEGILQVVTETAREIVGAHQSMTAAVLDGNWAHALVAVSYSDKYASFRDRSVAPKPDGSGLYSVVCRMNKPVRMTQREMEEHPMRPSGPPGEAVGGPGGLDGVAEAPPLRGWLAAPLTGRDGRNLGVVQLSDRCAGEFTDDDEAVLVQLAQMASIAIENTIYAEEREANRIKDEFLATLSHELRTPLNAVVGWTQLLRMEQDKLDPEVVHGLDVIERNVKAQTKLIEDLLDVSRITTGKLRLNVSVISLAPVVEAAADAVRPAADAKGVALDVTVSCDDQVSGDPDRLQQVVWNLLSNAVKFTPAGGRVGVALDRAGAQSRIRVSDSGQGISPKFLPYVFDRFRQADSTSTRQHGGLGIGLTIVRKIVELHGGGVEAESAGEGRGATFTVMLPVAAGGAEAQATRGGAAEAPAGPHLAIAAGPEVQDLGGLHVLLVDDEPDALEVIGEVLRRAGAQVTAASCADEAMELLVRLRPAVLISDIAMPGRDGFDLLRCVRLLPPHQNPQVPAVALTAYAREEDRARTRAAGFQIHLAKPVSPRELVAAVSPFVPADAPRLPELKVHVG